MTLLSENRVPRETEFLRCEIGGRSGFFLMFQVNYSAQKGSLDIYMSSVRIMVEATFPYSW